MVEIEVIQLPTGTKLFKNSANDAIATVDEHGYFTFQHEQAGKKPINATCPTITMDEDILKETYYKTGLIKHTQLTEADFLPIGHGGKREEAGRPRSDEPKTPYRITEEEQALIKRLRHIEKHSTQSKPHILKAINKTLDKLEGNAEDKKSRG